MTSIKISYKGAVAIIDAIEFRISSYVHQLTLPELSEDESSDISNDVAFLTCLHQDFKRELASMIDAATKGTL
jgi:hypothetical protein